MIAKIRTPPKPDRPLLMTTISLQKNETRPPQPAGTRPLVFHYHLFKNAGTSVDRMLDWNFGRAWTLQEFPFRRHANRIAVAEFVRIHPELRAISSHTALLPTPEVSGVQVIPVIFLRHPIDRLRSAYEFERRQVADTAGALLAKRCDLAEYLRELLRLPRARQARNFQTLRLSYNSPGAGSERERAIRTIAELPFVGVVEQFEQSIGNLEKIVRPYFRGFTTFNIRSNATQVCREKTLSERIRKLETAVGAALFDELCDANADDLFIHGLAVKSLSEPDMHANGTL